MQTSPADSNMLEGPPYVQVKDSRHCSSAWGENCCDGPNGHDGYHYDVTNGNKWTANVARCTCGSGSHPDNFAKHVAELQADNDELLTDSERTEWRA